MALDVQPLSRSRQAVMLLVLLGLLAGSLGLAQWLTAQARREQGDGQRRPLLEHVRPQDVN